MYLLYFKKCNNWLVYITNSKQFNFLSKRLSHKQSHTGKCRTFFHEPLLTCVISACHYGLVGFLHHCRITIIFRAICPGSPKSLSLSHRPLLVFLKRPSGLYTLQVSSRTPVACQRTEVVCVPLKMDTFQIVLHFKETYAS